MNKRIKYVLIALIVLLLEGYIVYKGFLLISYKLLNMQSYGLIFDNFEIAETITLNKKEVYDNDYLIMRENSYSNLFDYSIKIRNDFKDYEIINNIIFKKENDEVISGVIINKMLSLNYMYNNMELLFEEQYDVSLHSDNIKDILNYFILKLSIADIDKIVKENNIKNDIDVISNISNTNYNVNLFSSISTIKKAYTNIMFDDLLMSFTVTKICANSNNITMINGDYNGYICEANDEKLVIINDGVMNFEFSLLNKDGKFTNEYIKDLFSTLVVE